MTNATQPKTTEQLEFSTTFLTARELRRVERDPYLSPRDVYRDDHEEPPRTTCSSCGVPSIGTVPKCPDCAREEGRQ